MDLVEGNCAGAGIYFLEKKKGFQQIIYLLNKINDPEIVLEIKNLETKLVIRESCRRLVE